MLNKQVWKRFLIVLKTRDYSAMRRAIIYVVFRFLGLLFVIPTISILWILKPFVWKIKDHCCYQKRKKGEENKKAHKGETPCGQIVRAYSIARKPQA